MSDADIERMKLMGKRRELILQLPKGLGTL